MLDAFRSFLSQTEKINFLRKNNEKPSISRPCGSLSAGRWSVVVSIYMWWVITPLRASGESWEGLVSPVAISNKVANPATGNGGAVYDCVGKILNDRDASRRISPGGEAG